MTLVAHSDQIPCIMSIGNEVSALPLKTFLDNENIMRLPNIITLCFPLLILFSTNTSLAKESDWMFIIPDNIQKKNRNNYAERSYIVFSYFLNRSLELGGKEDFEAVTQRVRNRIFWKQSRRKKNLFVDAFHRSYPTLKHYQLPDEVPHMVLLIPYLESLWHSKAGNPRKDYGYWQLLNSIVKEIKELPTTPHYLRSMSINRIRTHHKYSTRVALLHLRRYYFYFNKVANFSKTDAWLLSITSYNWGSGNVKRLLQKMKREGIELNFSNFYHTLYQKQSLNPEDRSLRSAVEYLPHLWNISQVIRAKKHYR
ncbi:MAG: transglycosylase SLT domain-containing protein [Thiotrichaceae bacterium]|nr:transglycosylase SLT domain-containing protein [Thiotrichaceae bacterium]